MNPEKNQLASESGQVIPLDAKTYDSIFEHMLNGMAYCRMLHEEGGPDFIYLYTNPSFHRQTGLGEVEGKRVSEIVPGIRDSDPGLFEIYGRVAKTGIPEKFEMHVEALGDWFHINVYSPKSGYFVAIFDVITERKRTEEALIKSEERYRNIVETANEGIWSIDSRGVTSFVNPAMCRMLGYEAAEMIGRPVEDFLFEEDFSAHRWGQIERQAGKSGVYEMRMRRKDGETCWCRLNAVPLYDDSGKYAGSFAMITDITDKKRTDELVWRQANFDFLTRLPNRSLFMEKIAAGIRKSDRSGLPLALLILDLDRFKEINDTLGHEFGDLLLKETAQRLVGCLRSNDTVARLGGDEFAVIVEDLGDLRHVEHACSQIIDALAKPYSFQGQAIYLTTSIGITFYPTDAGDIETLVRNADQAMYAAKSKGRNGFSYFTPAMQASAARRLKLANELRTALEREQFRVHYQPIVELSTGRIVKCEALLRWKHPLLGEVSPSEFIPIAEDNGMILEIGDWVFREAMKQASIWRKQFDPDFQISVNKSPVQFRGESSWGGQLKDFGLPGSGICVEITESLLMEANSTVKAHLLQFRDAGIQVSMDDFGTGYSSLSYIKQFDIDYLKIDQSFVRNLTPKPEDMALPEAIIVMAHKLGMKVIAEGVETELQRNLLVSSGCDYAQGYFYSKPVPADEFEKKFMKGPG
ncbi:MAG: EAL domain-containing protein [Burkholderiales bacterium]|nr:EAL domain-containing protein [Burkholderiales bacterium]